MTNLEAGIRELIEELLGSVPDDSFAVLSFSSQALEELVTELEERFGLVVKAEDINPQTFRSVSSITAYLSHKK